MLHVLRQKAVFLVLFAVGAVAATLPAQVPTGSILGRVKDQQGLAIAGAAVTLTNQQTLVTHALKTTSKGTFEFPQLAVGIYRVEVSDAGFKTADVTNIKLDASTEYTVPPIVLEIGTVTETVSVQGGAETVRTAGAEITDTVEQNQIENLPILDRNSLALVDLEAGVDFNGRSDQVIDGQRESFTNMTLDGINIQDNFIRTSESTFYTPNLLLISQTGEFTIINQNAGPQAGMGASQISVITPSGTNNLHGEGFWFYRTDALAANDWFNDLNGVPKPNLLLNQGGGDLGGPIKKDKLFFYGAYEFLRYRQQIPADTTVLTPLARTGVFQWRATCTNNCPPGVSNGSIQSLNLLTYTGTSIDPVISGLLANVPTTINNAAFGDGLNTSGYSFNQRDNNTRDNTSARLDWTPSPHHTFSGTYAWNRDLLDRPGSTLGLPDTYSQVPSVYNNDKENFLSAAWRWSPSAEFTNEVRFGFDLAPVSFLTTQQFGSYTISGTLFNNPDQNEFPSGRATHTWSWQDNASKLHGNHLFSFGAQIQRVTVAQYNWYDTVPNLDLNPAYSANSHLLGTGTFASLGGISTTDLATANELLSTLAGMVGSETQTFNATSPTSGYVPGVPQAQDFEYDDWSLYFGDTWKLRRNLTLTYGLRWEYISPFDESHGLLQFPVIPAGETVQQALLSNASLAYFGGNTGRLPYNRDLHSFEPNLGIAWDPFGDGKTSVRLGYSINDVNDEVIGAPYNASLSNPGVSTQPGPFYLNVTGIANAPAIATPKMSNTVAGNWANLYGYETGDSYVYGINPNLTTPYVEQWNLTVQRDIGWKTSVTVSYVGNHGVKLYRAIDLNQVEINGNGFLQAFDTARQNGFASLAANGSFNPCYVQGGSPNCGASNPAVAYFVNSFFGGLLTSPGYDTLIDNDLQTGTVGELANLYHSIGYDAAYFGAPVALAPNQYVEAADLLGNYSSSNYNAGSVEIRRRFGTGLNLQASYTFSKVFTDFSADTVSGVERFMPYLDNANPGLEKERANFDLTHAFKANFIYQLPVGAGHNWSPENHVLNALVSGWAVSSIITWQSGAPFSILSGLGTLNRDSRSTFNTAYTTSSVAQIRSDLGIYHLADGQISLINPEFIGPNGTGIPNFTSTVCTPIIAGGFCNPAPGAVGNLPRNAFNGPPFFNMDLAILKNFPFGESKSVEYRVEMFNALNHPTFQVGDPAAGITDMNINATNFGQAISTMSTPRVIQMGLRLIF